jgi:pimeloyl-[acyl-carrier protein] methyl ester esterase
VFEAFAESMQTNRDATLTRFASLQAQGDAAMKAAALQLRAGLAAEAQASTAVLQHGLRVLLDTDLRESLGSIGHETLVIHGEADRLTPFAAGEHLARTLKRGRLCAISGAAHAPFVTAADAVAAALKDFLQ